MSKKGRGLSGPEQAIVTGGAILTAIGVVASGWGLLNAREPWREQVVDSMDCSPYWQAACDQLQQDNREISQDLQVVGDGLVLAVIGGAGICLTFRRAKNADSASSVRLPVDVEYYRLVEGSLEQAPGIPDEPSKSQL